MSERDELHQLREANPQPVTLLSSSIEARLRARIEEKIMNDTTQTKPFWDKWQAAVAGVVLAGAAAFAFISLAQQLPTPSGPSVPLGNAMAMCADMESVGGLAAREFAFDGTVTAIDGDQATFTINESFGGVDSNEVTLEAAGLVENSEALLGGPGLEIGGRYLVAGDENFAWSCGFTQTYSEATAAEWRAER